ncbi:MAG: hypothetical protein LBU73_08015 [Helicobacteraceae bacterium]|jgi:hypothetical protein|nr:hypothetical protein [Helicobacteraceae bacterium]
MTFDDLKKAIHGLTLGDANLPTDDELVLIVAETMSEAAVFCRPISLISTNPQDFAGESPLMALGAGAWLRKPKKPQIGEELDIDDGLFSAVAHLTAAKLVRNLPELNRKTYHEDEARKAMNAYMWARHRTTSATYQH